ncbi:MAG: hypothetical protein CM15mP17_00110 [Gammaproteobacteria bacterium]|nr:MAG: hypothetical protein CM15mP17_00110 [Gammaproteobacteria bacterium]
MQVSILDSIIGVGPRTKERLFNEFKSIDVIKKLGLNHLIKKFGVGSKKFNGLKKFESS